MLLFRDETNCFEHPVFLTGVSKHSLAVSQPQVHFCPKCEVQFSQWLQGKCSFSKPNSRRVSKVLTCHTNPLLLKNYGIWQLSDSLKLEGRVI
jgi:hypothetical protein